MKLKLDIKELKKLVPVLRTVHPAIVGLALIGVFAYTSMVVNAALDVQEAKTTAAKSGAKITFDKATIEAVNKLEPVNGSVPIGELGQDDPFK